MGKPYYHTVCIKLAGKPYDLSSSSNASRLTIRLADECTKGPCCIFNALDCVKLQRGPSEHPSASRITIRLTLEFAGKPYDLPATSNASRITKRLADGCSKGPRCVSSALNCVKLQREPLEHPSASRITIRFALELAGKPYDLPASSNASRLTIRLADGCSEDPRCVFSALDYVKLQRGSSEHPSASCLRCVFSALDCVKLQRGSFEHPSAIRITIRLALELVDKPYDLSVSSNASRLTIRLADVCAKGPRCVFSALDFNARCITKRLADGCSEGPRCFFSALNYVKLQCGFFEHSSASRITIRLALKLADKPYDLLASSNANRLTIRLADGCSEGSRCVFSSLEYIKLQHGSSEHPSANGITIRLALKFVGKPYDLPANSNANRITKRLVDGCSKGSRCVFSALNCVKLQHGPSEHPSANRIIIRLALELVDKPYDLPASCNASRITIRLADECSEGPRCVFNTLNYVKSQRGPSKHSSASRMVQAFTMADNNTNVFKTFAAEDRLDGDNYPLWAYMMQHVLVSKGIWNIVQGIDVSPGFEDVGDVDDVAGFGDRVTSARAVFLETGQTHWDIKDAQAHAWDILASLYASRNEAKIALLCKELESKIMHEDDEMDTFLAGVNEINEQFIFVGEVISDSFLVQIVLDALPDSYQTFASTWSLITQENPKVVRPVAINGLPEAIGTIDWSNDTGQVGKLEQLGSRSTSSTNDMGQAEQKKQKAKCSSSIGDREEDLPTTDRIYDDSRTEEIDSSYAAKIRIEKEA
ncbi:hypothetical protein L7F22_065609 [Adiantum nelumboides]|nr:hypothetical protein [Adiantum nelumboides]